MELDASAPVDGVEFGTASSPAVSPNAPARIQKFVTFFIGGRQYALHSSAVAEVTSKLNSTPLPDAPAQLIGIAPLRGEIVAVIDPGVGSEISSHGPSQKRKTVVLKTFEPAEEMPIAFDVDRLGEFVSIDLESIKPIIDASEPFATLEAASADGLIRIVEPSRLAAFLHR